MSPRFVIACAAPQRVVFYSDALRAVGVPMAAILGVYPGWTEGPAGPEDANGAQRPDGADGADGADAADAAADVVAGAAALVLCGGEDVDPSRYGESAIPAAGIAVDSRRDAFEWRLLDAARAAGTPVLGVCRGAQVLNVYLGGTLYQDLPLQRPSAVDHSIVEPRDALAHTLEIDPELADGHPLARVLAGHDIWVNSRHHQAVRDLAPGLRPFAIAPDGLVEGYYLEPVRTEPAAATAQTWGAPLAAPWQAAGVQWHPENLVAMPQHRAFWTTFIEECAR